MTDNDRSGGSRPHREQMRVTFYHVTTPAAAEAILATGFRDHEEDYGFRDETGHPVLLRGVWVSDRPLRIDEFTGSFDANVVLAITVTLDPDTLDDAEVIEEGRSYREWCMPAHVLNAGTVELVRDDPDIFP